MTRPENEPPPFAPAAPPPFPDAQPPRRGIGRRKLAALAGILPLGAVAIGSAQLARNAGDAHSATPGTTTTTATPTTITTQTAPAAVLAPEIARIGGRHIAALHAIHNYMSHIYTYNPVGLDEYFAGAIATSTGAYRQQLIDTQRATRDYLVTTNSRSEILEFNAGLRAVNGTTALAVGYVKQSTTSNLTASPGISLIATVVTAEEQPDGQWLVSDLKRIST
ncbi:hypothetical protein AB0H76_03315 [Nocardia sp. NPDC050712]|uniref:hypothetical protein n=1 Tax=Nocardia sp. NPDC050712 TaxID=3155518 RepID=UPI0033DC9F3E